MPTPDFDFIALCGNVSAALKEADLVVYIANIANIANIAKDPWVLALVADKTQMPAAATPA